MGNMGRTRTFDAGAVVEAARGVFWDLGFAEASVPELERATGLNRSSLYQAFGSKRGLFDAAVASYLDDVFRPRLAPLRAAEVEPGALEDYLTGLREAMIERPSARAANGCLLLAAAGGPLGQDAALQAIVVQYYAELRAALAAGVAVRHPRLGAARARALTTSCTSFVLSAMALVRADPAAAADMLDAALDAVRTAR